MKYSPSTDHSPLTIGFSPCPNDCFIFDALIHGKVDTEGLTFKPVIEDVEALNKKALKIKLDVTKISFFTFSKVQEKYALLDSGGALGFGVGPLVISDFGFRISDLNNGKIAIPGKNTTANLLFSLAFPKATNKIEMLFSEIEDAILKRKVDAGVIIHESRFTYKQKGLKKITDLGKWYEKKTKQPIPLGGIVMKKSLPKELRNKVNRIIRRSVEFAFVHPDSSKAFIKKYAQEMDDAVIKKHIALYVNKFSISMKKKGNEAVKFFMKKIEGSNIYRRAGKNNLKSSM